ncbi:hypothetical protein [Nocardia noduli]|uniref:WXG100-like domain-containing protein n=1 Tax=Nocardia noduli TaxID=2815722 RepID=UPI001C23BFAB|nr:hypothetical protein [Nocardia noduli]
MPLQFPSWAEPIEWLVGADWPHGNEDLMREMGRDLTDVADEIRSLIPELDGIISGLETVYPEGSGGEGIVAWMKPLRDSSEGNNGSLQKFADNYDLLAGAADSMGDQIEAAKLNFYISFGWVLGELALALASGPFSPFSTAAVFASARAAFRVIANRLFGRIAAIIARIAGGRISAVAVKHVLMEGLQEALVEVLQGTTQELMVQTYQNSTGAVDGYDWNAVGQNAAVSAVAGGAGGLTGGLMGRRFDTSMGGWRGAFNGAVVGAGGGLGGAVAAGLMTGEWDPRSLTGGMFSGAGPGAIRGSYGVPNTSASNIPTTTVPTIDGTAPTVPSVDGTGPTPTPTAETDPAANPTSETSTPTNPASATDPAATNSPATSPAAGTSPAGNPTSEAGPSADPTAESNAATDTNAPNSPAANAASETSPDKDTTATPVDATESSPSSDPATNPAADSNANTEQKSPPATGDRGDNSTASNESGGPRESPGHTAPTSQQDSGANTDSAPRDAAQSTPDHGPSDSAGNDHTNHQDRAGTAGDTATDPAATSRGTTPTTTASPSETTAGPVGTHAMPSASESGTPGSPVQASSTTAVPNAAAASAPTSPSTAGQPASNTLASPATSSAQSHPPASTSAGSPTAAAQSPQSNAQNEVARARTPAASLSVPTDESRTPVAGPRASSTGTAVTSPVDAAPQAASPEIDVDQGTPTIEVGLPAMAVIAGPALDTPRTTPRTPRTPWNGGVGEHRGTASPVADFHGDARPTGQPDLDMAQLMTEIGDNLRLITPEMMAFNRDGDYFVLPDGREIHLRIAPTDDGAVAEFGPHDKGYEIRVSPRARTSDVARAIAHELSEIALSLDPTIDIDPVSEAPTSMTTHLGGRFAELRVLLAHIDRATFDPARASQLPSLRHDLADLAAHLGLDGQGGPNSDLLREHDPRLARRLALEQDSLIAARPTVGPDTSDLDAGATDYDARLANLDGDFADSLRRMEEAGLQGRAREELARRVFDPLFTGPEAKAARATVPTTVLLDALDPINAALNDTTTTETERARAVDAAIDGFRAAMPDAFREVFGDHGFQRMHDAAAALGNQPRRITAELDHGAGTVDVDGRTTPFADFLHDVDRANRAATDLGIEVEYTVVVHDPVDGRSGVEILPRPRPQHRLPLPQNVFGEDNHRITHQPRPTAPAVAAGGHTIDVGVGRSAFGVEMTPTADRAGGGLIIKTELASEFPVAAQRRRDRGVLDPGPLTEPGTVMVFGDLLFNGNVLAQAGVGSIGRIFVNNVSAKFSPAQYDALAAALVASLAPGARIELQWDTKPESATGHVNDRGHIDGDQLLDALRRQFPDSDLPFRVEERTEFPPPGNNDYDYTIDAGGSNVLNRAKMAGFAAPRPDHRMVIVYEPTGVDLPTPSNAAVTPVPTDTDTTDTTGTTDTTNSTTRPPEDHRGAAAALGRFHGDARPSDQPDLTDPQLRTELDDNLALIDPDGAITIREPGTVVLPDGTEVRIRVAPTEDNAVATFARDGDHYEVHVSPRARTEDIPRALAHELSEITLVQLDSIDIDPVSERPAQLTAHLGGRFAEMRVLLSQINSALADPDLAGRLPSLRQDLADLADRLGLTGPERSAAARQLLEQHDATLATLLAAEHPPDSVTADTIEQTYGIPRRNQQRLWDYARQHNVVLFVRPTNPDAVPHLLRDAVPKPMAIKDKTINALDIALGAKPWSKGLVGRFPPGSLSMPDTTGMDPDYVAALESRLAARTTDFETYAKTMDDYAVRGKFRTTEDGVVQKFDRGRFRDITGDHDLFDIRHPNGDPVSPAELKAHENRLQALELGVQHGPHMYWDPPDTFQRLRNFEPIIGTHQPSMAPDTKNEPLIVFTPDGAEPRIAFADRDAATIDRMMLTWRVEDALLRRVPGDTTVLRARVTELAARPDFDPDEFRTWREPGARVPIAVEIDGEMVPFMAIDQGPDTDPVLVRMGTPAHELAVIRDNARQDMTPDRIAEAAEATRTEPEGLPQAENPARAREMARESMPPEPSAPEPDADARAALIEELEADGGFDADAYRAWSGDGRRVAMVVDVEIRRVGDDGEVVATYRRPMVKMAIVTDNGEVRLFDVDTPARLRAAVEQNPNIDDRTRLTAELANAFPADELPGARNEDHAIELAGYMLNQHAPHDHTVAPSDPGAKAIADLSDHPDGVTRDADGLITHIGRRPIEEVVDAIARDRADKFVTANAKPPGETAKETAARVKRWQAKNILANEKSHGKVSAVVMDRRTGIVYEGFNGAGTDTLPVDDTHPTIEHNVTTMRRLGQLTEQGGYPAVQRPDGGRAESAETRPYPHFDNPYGHAEVKAANEALHARTALGLDASPAAMAELYSQTYALRPRKDRAGNPLPLDPRPYCANCHHTMGGATNYSGRYRGYPHTPDNLIDVHVPQVDVPNVAVPDAHVPAPDPNATEDTVTDPGDRDARHPVEDPDPDEEGPDATIDLTSRHPVDDPGSEEPPHTAVDPRQPSGEDDGAGNPAEETQ